MPSLACFRWLFWRTPCTLKKVRPILFIVIYLTRLALKKLEPSNGVIQSLKKNFYSVLILHLLKPLFSVFHVFQALSIFVLVSDFYIDDPFGSK